MTGNDESGAPDGSPSSEPLPPERQRADDAPTEEVPRRGRIRQQDENTTPREPTLAERRARQQAARRKREEEERRCAEEEAGRRKRKRILIGAGVTVGVVALIAVGYAVAQPDNEIDAQCVDEETGIVVDDSNCAVPASNTTYHGSGGGLYPIFIGLGGRQYHYNYGGTGTIGQPVSGGTTVVPRDGTKVRTSSGSTTVSRGGLGVGSSSSSGGSAGGSKSGSKSGGSKSSGS